METMDMDNNTKNTSSSLGVCCVCIKKYWYLESVYEEDEHKVKHSEKLFTCIPNEVWYKNYKICKNCIENLELAFQFVLVCTTNETKRREVYETNTSPFRCNDCKKSFKVEVRLKKHILESHFTYRVLKSEETAKKDLVENENIGEGKLEQNSLTDNDICKSAEEKDLNHRPVRAVTQNKVIEDQVEDELSDNDDNDNNVDDNSIKSDTSTSDCENDYKPARRKRSKKTTTAPPRTKKKKEKGIFKCEYCPDIFNTAKILQKHTITKHTFERPYKCDQCDATYRGKDMLTVHKRSHTGETPYICSVCGKAFKSSHGLFVHNQLHSSEKAYACPLCPKAFKTQAHLRTHRIGVHTKPEELKYQCPQCGHKFPFKGHLDKHLVRHSGIKNCPCRICGKMFVSNSDAELHIKRTHRNDNLSTCKVCGKQFKSSDGLHKHLKTAHDIGDYKVPVHEKKLLCPYCPKMFPFNHKLQRHILTHTGEKPFKCNLCGKGFRDRTDLKTHLRNAHQIANNV